MLIFVYNLLDFILNEWFLLLLYLAYAADVNCPDSKFLHVLIISLFCFQRMLSEILIPVWSTILVFEHDC